MPGRFPFFDYYGFFPKRNPDEQVQRLIRQLAIDMVDEQLWERLFREATRRNLIIRLSDPYLRADNGGLYVMDIGHHVDTGALALQVFEQSWTDSKPSWYLPVLEISDYLDTPIEIHLVRSRDIP